MPPGVGGYGDGMLDMDGADDLVRAGVDHGEAGVPGGHRERDDVGSAGLGIHRVHPYPRCHDVGGGTAAEGQRALHEAGGRRIEHPLLG